MKDRTPGERDPRNKDEVGERHKERRKTERGSPDIKLNLQKRLCAPFIDIICTIMNEIVPKVALQL